MRRSKRFRRTRPFRPIGRLEALETRLPLDGSVGVLDGPDDLDDELGLYSGSSSVVAFGFGAPLVEPDAVAQDPAEDPDAEFEEPEAPVAFVTTAATEPPADDHVEEDGKKKEDQASIPFQPGDPKARAEPDETGNPDDPEEPAAVDPPEDSEPPELPEDPGVPLSAPTLSDAVDLGTVGSEVVRTTDALELDTNPNDVRLFRIEVPDEAGFSRLGLEVESRRLGEPLEARVSLFDAEGGLIATRDANAGALSDPFLFAGVEPGVYFVGVSAAPNDPSAPKGFNLASGFAGGLSSTRSLEGGRFDLAVVADPAEEPARVVDLTLQRRDPADPVPTGFQLHFDGPLTFGELDLPANPDELNHDLEVVDETGRRWPVALIGFGEDASTVEVLFIDRPAVGAFEVHLGAESSLRDLTGRAPVGKHGPDGPLATFRVASQPARRDEADLGPLFPREAVEGRSLPVELDPGEVQELRFVVTFEAAFEMKFATEAGTPAFELIGPDGPKPFDTSPASSNGSAIKLKPGVHRLRITADGDEPLVGTASIEYLWDLNDSLLPNGVGQGPALAVRLAGSPVLEGPSPRVVQGPVTGGGGEGLTAVFPSANAARFQSPSNLETIATFDNLAVESGNPVAENPVSGTSGAFVALSAGPIGRPSDGPNRVAAARAGTAIASISAGEALFGVSERGVGQSVASGSASGSGLALGTAGAEGTAGSTPILTESEIGFDELAADVDAIEVAELIGQDGWAPFQAALNRLAAFLPLGRDADAPTGDSASAQPAGLAVSSLWGADAVRAEFAAATQESVEESETDSEDAGAREAYPRLLGVGIAAVWATRTWIKRRKAWKPAGRSRPRSFRSRFGTSSGRSRSWASASKLDSLG